MAITGRKARLAMIGCGGIGQYHLKHFVQFTDIIEFVGFCDIIPERAEDFVKTAGAGEAFADFKEMLNKTSPDLVFVCVPPYCHGEIEYTLIEKKIHFFVEKPLHLDIEVAKDILKKSEAAGLITASGFQCRYSSLVEPTKEFIENNKLCYVECQRMGGVPGAPWWKVKSLSGGQAVEQTIHQFDMIRYVYGEPETVFTLGTKGIMASTPEGFDTDELTVTCVKYKSGALGTISTGCYVEKGDAFDSKITFSSQTARAEHKLLTSLKVFGATPVKEETAGGNFVIKGDGGVSAGSGEATVTKEEGDAGVKCDRTYIEAVISGDASKVRSPYRDALKSLAFTLACNISMESGKAVNIDELLSGI